MAKQQIMEEENQEIELSFIGGNAHLTQEEREVILIIDDKK